MSLYNLMHGYNGSCIIILPMLGKHPDEYPRFRDCFTEDEEHPEYANHILVYTRVGGGNRGGEWEKFLKEIPGFVATYDDSFDNTFGMYVYEVPEKWKADFDAIKKGLYKDISDEYWDEVKRIYPFIDKINMLTETEKEHGGSKTE